MVVKMIKFAICDDESFVVEELSQYISKYMENVQAPAYEVKCYSSGRSLLESGRGFDVIFLDIQMEQPDGMETARILRQQDNHSLLIFITALKEYVFDSFEVQAYDYLLKPIGYARLKRTLDRAITTLKAQTSQRIVVQRGAAYEVIPLSEILYCEVQGRKIYIHKKDGKVTDYYDKLNNFEQHVDSRFFKCHRSYLVNLDYVRGIREGQAILPGDNAIPVSRLRERELSEALLRYMKEKGY